MTLYLYLVTASETDYDSFHEGVVYAESGMRALEMVHDLCMGRDGNPPANTGSWMRLAPGALLTAKRVSIRPGPVMGYSRAG
jgi:hypothetical protein